MTRQKSNAEIYFEQHQRYQRALEFIKLVSVDQLGDDPVVRLAEIRREADFALRPVDETN